MADKGLDVTGFIIRSAVLPAAPEDADPFEGEGAEGGVVAVSAGAKVVVEGFGPGAPLAGMVGELLAGRRPGWWAPA